MSNKADIERFEEKFIPVTECGCWVWVGASSKRYGSFYLPSYPVEMSKNMVSAHKAALFLYKGIIPQIGEEVLHSCDNGFCCNPNHLSLGSHQDNMTDMVLKGRSPKNKRKLTDQEIEDARLMRSNGIQVKEIAKIFDISSSQMSRITQGTYRKGAIVNRNKRN